MLDGADINEQEIIMPASNAAKLAIHPGQVKDGPIPARIFGNFLEHLGYAVDGGILAQALANPTFERDAYLSQEQKAALLSAGKILTDFYLRGCDPKAIPEHWSPGIAATGFGVCALDDASGQNVPFPWAPLGAPGQVTPSVGRVGGSVRLRGITWDRPAQVGEEIPQNDGPTGIRQGIFLPFQRCLGYQGHLILRIASEDPGATGQVEVGLWRRFRIASKGTPVGECLALDTIQVQGNEWVKIPFRLELSAGQVSKSEPVDFFVRWIPVGEEDLLIDRTILLPADAVEGIFDPDVLKEIIEWKVPLLRWPGGNFGSYYHWRDGVGPFDRRPTRPNYAWGGLETNFFGTVEFIRFCRLIGAEPHITVNTGTGTSEEAADWVEFCNGAPETPMGARRMTNGDRDPYQVRLWEVGNEIYGSWQGGYHGSDENAERFCEFAQAMRAVDPALELIATGNQFDIAQPNPALDHTTADRMWNKKVIKACPEQMDYLSLHCLPANDILLEKLTPRQAYYSLLGQPDSWEREFIPQIKRLIDAAMQPGREKPPIRLAITEWGVLGSRHTIHPVVENYGEVVYAGVFLNMCIRNQQIVPVANATGLMHGGCIRKAAGQVFHDPQYTVVQKYTELANTYQLASELVSSTFDVDTAPDLGLPLKDISLVDAIACLDKGTGRITVCAINRQLDAPIELDLALAGDGITTEVEWEFMTYPDVTARARLGDPERFKIENGRAIREGNGCKVLLPACSVNWISWRF
jgi:alpha-N-arabinofuranosidase